MRINEVFLFVIQFLFTWDALSCTRSFPENFKFGVSTSAYQIEGAWNVSGKGESIWDHLTHHKRHLVADESNADITCNSYYNYKEDVKMLVNLGVDRYRFSLSWTRICPTGFCNVISKAGINFYNNVINELIKNNIEPVVTIYHMDLPQSLQDLGGWTNPYILDYFLHYSQVVFDNFGDRVKMWLTVNEPKDVCLLGYGEQYYAPALNSQGIGDYLCTRNILKGHALVYRLYNETYREKQRGRIGLTLSIHWFEPADNSSSSIEAAEIISDFENGLYANPIFSKSGDYPSYVKQRMEHRSKEQNFIVNRLRPFSPFEVELIKGTSDFLGLNHYSTRYTMLANEEQLQTFSSPSLRDDHQVNFFQDESWPSSSSSWLRSVPWGFKKLLNWIRTTYYNPEIIVFENGVSDFGGRSDEKRVEYLKNYMNALLDAIDDGCNVTSYMVWSLMDNFEWLQGYTEPFGLYHVDFNDPGRKRTPKMSADFYKKVISERKL